MVTAANGKRGAELGKIIMPDLIICDIMMPELDGYDVLKIFLKMKKQNEFHLFLCRQKLK